MFRFLTVLLLAASLVSVSAKPKIVILATGGTIAGQGESATGTRYTAGKLPIDQLLNAVPAIHDKAEITGEQIASIGSQAMHDSVELKLANRINEILKTADGVVITHGTDTKEETAFFLQLTIKSTKPVVLTSAMRNATSISADGPKNLFDAVCVAADPNSAGRGVLVVANDLIFSARDAVKTNTTNVATWQSPTWGPLGVIFNGLPRFYHRIDRKHTSQAEFDVKGVTVLPRVEILYGYTTMNADLVNALVDRGVKGIIFAGVGNGNIYPEVQDALAAAVKKGVVVVRDSRVPSGLTTLDAETDDKALGFVVADDLSPQKARILLKLALMQKRDQKDLQRLFFTY